MNEMNMFSDGDVKDHVEFWMKDHPCPNCKKEQPLSTGIDESIQLCVTLAKVLS